MRPVELMLLSGSCDLSMLAVSGGRIGSIRSTRLRFTHWSMERRRQICQFTDPSWLITSISKKKHLGSILFVAVPLVLIEFMFRIEAIRCHSNLFSPSVVTDYMWWTNHWWHSSSHPRKFPFKLVGSADIVRFVQKLTTLCFSYVWIVNFVSPIS